MTYEEFIALPVGRVLKREIIHDKHQKNIIVGVVRTVICNICCKKCISKSIQTQTTGNVRLATICMVCGYEEMFSV